MTPTARSFRRALSALVLACAACEGAAALPTLAPIDPAEGRVNEALRIEIAIDNPSGRPVELRVEGPTLPSFDRVTSVTTQPSGGVFTWAPISSHAGVHELTFVLAAPGGGAEHDRQSVLVTILPAEDAAPVFVRPGAGGTYDLTLSPCVTFDVEVRDDDSDAVEIGTRVDPPAGATLANAGPKRARFDWCPSADQVGSSERWTVQLFADDGAHPPVEHDYVLVLRSGPAREDCPGAAPVITLRSPLEGERITSGTTYAIEASISDDAGLRDAPILYYTTEAPEDPSRPDVTQFELVTFADEGGGRFVASIPSLALAEGEEAQVFYLVSATDNDDAGGSLCDHRAESALVGFVAVGGPRAVGSLAECDRCAASTECASGICAAGAGGGRCVDSCSGTGACDAGVCGATVTTEGGAPAGCGPVRELCEGASGCTDDAREEDDAIGAATLFASPITDGQVCPGDEDFVRISVPAGNRVSVTLDGFVHAEGDLDLQLQSGSGAILASSASVRDLESVEHCNGGAATDVYARVYGYGASQNHYALGALVAPDPVGCCTDDALEDDDTLLSARTPSFVASGASERADLEGRLCPSDDDWIAIPMSGPGRIQILLEYEHAAGDIDIQLYDPAGARIGASLGETGSESIDASVSSGGTYALRIFAYSGGNTELYIGELVRTAAGCESTSACPPDTVCRSGTCGSDVCTSAADCPSAHSCPTAGPGEAARHCAASCAINTDCRDVEACKWFVDGRGCGRRGGGANGDRCASYADCGGQRTCVGWPSGYCARAGCASSADCESGTYCVSQGGVNVCALSCVSLPCRDAEGYGCTYAPTLGGIDRFVCLPR